MAIVVFKNGKFHSELDEWDTSRVPNNSWILDGQGRWYSKVVCRLMRHDLKSVPAIYKAWALIL